MLQQVDLGLDGINHIRWSLSQSLSSLSSYLLQTLPLDAGRVFTFAPTEIGARRLANFREGIFGAREAPKALDRVCMLAVAYLRRSGPRYLIFEDVNAQVGDPWLKNAFVRAVSYDGEIYHVLGTEDVDKAAVRRTMSYAKGYVTNGILTGSLSIPPLQPGQHLEVSQLIALAEATDFVLVEAYDGESFVIWSRRRRRT